MSADPADFELPLDPSKLATLLSHERAQVYRRLGLHSVQISVAEEAVRGWIRKEHRRRMRQGRRR